MKSNKFISLLAMTAVLAGCSQEEFATIDDSAKVDLSARPVLGNVDLNVGAETRMTIKNGSAINIAYETGDQIGAALIDKPNTLNSVTGYIGTASASWNYAEYTAGTRKNVGTSTAGKNKLVTETFTTSGGKILNTPKPYYDLTDFISSNYPYTRAENGAFTTPANLVEGNYLFYMPYNAAHLLRTNIEVVLPQVQDCSDAVMKETTWKKDKKVNSSSTVLSQFYKGTMKGFEKAPAVVGYKFLAAPADGSIIEPSVKMNEIFAVPLITINNNFNGLMYAAANKSLAAAPATATIKIDSIQIYHATANLAQNKLFYKADLSANAIAGATGVLNKDGEWGGKKLTAGAPTADLLTPGFTLTTANLYPKHQNTGLDVTKLTAATVDNGSKYGDATSTDKLCNRVTCVLNKELKPGESYSFHAILPAANYGKNLKARVFATINGKRYMIVSADNTPQFTTTPAPTITHYVSNNHANYSFYDAVNGGEDCELVRAEQFPKAEIREDGKGLKAFAGDMMTINLASTVNKLSGVISGATAFELSEKPATPSDHGLFSNEDFINYLIDNVQRGVELNEVDAMKTTPRDQWKTYNTSVTPSAGNIAFAANNQIVINAQLIKDLKNQTITDDPDATKLVLEKANFPVANDVTFADDGSGIYTFTTLDTDAVSYKIDMSGSGVAFGTDPAKLVSGINKITLSGNKELKPTNSKVNNAAVVLSGAFTAKYTAKSTGISAIYLGAGTILDVEVACDAMIINDGGTIKLGANASLTNENNNLVSGDVENYSLRPIAGKVKDVVKVKANYAVAWPTEALPDASRVNYITINLGVAGDVAVEQAQFDLFKDLNKVEIVLGKNINNLTSINNITLNRIKKISSANAGSPMVNWNTTNNVGITITKASVGGGKTDIDGTSINAGANVTFK